ncbi:phosphate acyltransferase [Lacticaseibacillus rhamnosus]|nr:phosphate acyltransferase [Lacticaseibacillus rhamnosus]
MCIRDRVLAAQAVKQGEAAAMVSLGSTGALLAAGLFIIGRIRAIERPGLLPTPVSYTHLTLPTKA